MAFPDSLSVSLSLSLSLSLFHLILTFIALSTSSKLHPASTQSYCPCEGVNRKTLLMSSSLLLQLCLAYLIRLIWMVLEIGDNRAVQQLFRGVLLSGVVLLSSQYHCAVLV